MAQQANEAVGKVTGKARVRSPAYPAIDLAQALQRAAELRKEANRSPVHVDRLLEIWGFKPKSGGGMAVLSALIKFGLLDDEGTGETRRARLTPFALGILLDDQPDSPERLSKIREAALRPSIHKELWERYQGSLPGDGTMRVYLRRDRGFRDEAADALIKEFRATIAYSRLTESDTISPLAQDKTEKDEPDGGFEMVPPEALAQSTEKSEPLTGKKAGERVNRTVQIPLTGAPWAMLQVPYPMTDENWKEMEEFLRLMKKPLTTPIP